jgi:hypothetical protein
MTRHPLIGVPLLRFHSHRSQSSTRLASTAIPLLACPRPSRPFTSNAAVRYLPAHAPPLQSRPIHCCHSRSLQSPPVQSRPRLSNTAFPILPFQSAPRPNSPVATIPHLYCQSNPALALRRHSTPLLPFRFSPRPSVQDSPCDCCPSDPCLVIPLLALPNRSPLQTCRSCRPSLAAIHTGQPRSRRR